MKITIDGPAGSGKSTAARNLSRVLGIAFLDTGATYRAVTLRAMRAGIDLADAAAMADQARQIDLELVPDPDGLIVRMDGEDVSAEIRTEVVTANARYAARPPEVREVLVDLQRKIGAELGDFVTEGRDQGSVVFPDADVKFYLDADTRERARRRCAELQERGEAADVNDVEKAIVDRDHSDRSRDVGPLIVPDGAIRVDTSKLTPEETLQTLLKVISDFGFGISD